MSLRFAAAALALLTALTAQDARDLSTPVEHATVVGATVASINAQVAQGYRLTNITYRGSNILGTTFDAVFVKNSGVYATGWWWYYGLTATQVSANLATNQARLIDLDPYADSNGNLRFACIMVDNTGSHLRGWRWQHNSTVTAIMATASANNSRVIDLDRYVIGNTTYYSAVMIANTGADFRNWWLYTGLTPTQITGYLTTNTARLYDLEPNGTGTFDCVMIRDNTFQGLYYWFNITSSDIAYLMAQYGVRAIDVSTYLTTAGRRYALVAINNSNAVTTTVGNVMRNATDGQIGIWLQQMNGPNLASLNGDTVFEPAGTITTLSHVHAMHQVEFGLPISTPLTQWLGMQPNTQCPNGTNPLQSTLRAVLSAMMWSSTTAAQAIRQHFGESNINATAAALGMTHTGLHHTLGCVPEAVANPNAMTLADLHTLHEQVKNGYLGSQRQMFYDLMYRDIQDYRLDLVISAEGIALGLNASTIVTFKNLTHVAHGFGRYTLTNGGAPYYAISDFGWMSIPFFTNNVLTPREYGIGIWINNASDLFGTQIAFSDGLEELVRPTIRAALLTWTNNLAGLETIGHGCGWPYYTQTVTSLPRIGRTARYVASPGFLGQLVVMGVGFSSSSWNGIPLPAALEPYGGAPYCKAEQDVVTNYAALSDYSGGAAFDIALPNSPAYLGFRYLTQFYSLGGSEFITSNTIRSTVGP
jgi:hypothetical protein